jgi:hypothetical protein
VCRQVREGWVMFEFAWYANGVSSNS